LVAIINNLSHETWAERSAWQAASLRQHYLDQVQRVFCACKTLSLAAPRTRANYREAPAAVKLLKRGHWQGSRDRLLVAVRQERIWEVNIVVYLILILLSDVIARGCAYGVWVRLAKSLSGEGLGQAGKNGTTDGTDGTDPPSRGGTTLRRPGGSVARCSEDTTSWKHYGTRGGISTVHGVHKICNAKSP